MPESPKAAPPVQPARDALLWKLAGLSECDVRRPMVPIGTNLLRLRCVDLGAGGWPPRPVASRVVQEPSATTALEGELHPALSMLAPAVEPA